MGIGTVAAMTSTDDILLDMGSEHNQADDQDIVMNPFTPGSPTLELFSIDDTVNLLDVEQRRGRSYRRKILYAFIFGCLAVIVIGIAAASVWALTNTKHEEGKNGEHLYLYTCMPYTRGHVYMTYLYICIHVPA